ncbi:MAG: hypothetical protein HDQ91_05500 [Desulfovibrio sp.]|nr:hypothetical protein [Desulfovibrio sp.]
MKPDPVAAFAEILKQMNPRQGKKAGATGWALVVIQTYDGHAGTMVQGAHFAVGDIDESNLGYFVAEYAKRSKEKEQRAGNA